MSLYWRETWRDSWRRRAPGLRVLEEGSGRIFPVEKLRAHLNIDPIDGDSDNETHPDDELLLEALEDAVDYAEEFTGLSIVRRTYEMALDAFPLSSQPIELAASPLIGIELESFIFAEGSEGEVEPEAYVLDYHRTPARIVPTAAWPSMTRATNTVRIRFRAGYSNEVEPDSDALMLPRAIRRAVLLLTGHFYENREATAERALSTIPLGVHSMLRTKRILLGMA